MEVSGVGKDEWGRYGSLARKVNKRKCREVLGKTDKRLEQDVVCVEKEIKKKTRKERLV